MRKIRKSSNKKFIAIAVVLLLAISIGYAALSTTLSINGTANIASSSWLVYFTNVQVTTGSVTATIVPTISGTSTTTLTWAVTLNKPGDFYEYIVDVKNDGSIDAMIGSLSNTTLTTAQANYLDYTVTYSDGAVIEQYDKLDSGETVKVKVRLEFKRDLNPEDLPGEGANIGLTYSSNYVQADGNAKDRNTVASLNIGDSVNYSTSMNGVTLDNWKVFYVDGDYTTLIYGDYLPNSAIDNTTTPFSNLLKKGTYELYVHYTGDRIQLLDAMQTKSNWDSLLTGTINGAPINVTRTSNVWAMGSPTLDLWVNSWNVKYPENKIYTATTESTMNDGLNGFYVGLTVNPTGSRKINLELYGGYDNTLYFPYHISSGCQAYWLASPSAKDNEVMKVDYSGEVRYSSYDSGNAFRPVVSLPTSTFE